MRKLIIFLPIASAIWLIATVLLGSINHSGYHHISQYISELGATDAPNGKIVSLLGFIPTSLLLTVFALYAISISSRRPKQVLGLAGIGVYAVTLGIAALYPCDAGCRPDNPSTSQIVHNASAILGYLSGIVGIFLLAFDTMQMENKRLGAIGLTLGGLALLMFFLLDPGFPFVGLAQRTFELSMYTWIILYAFYFREEVLNKKY